MSRSADQVLFSILRSRALVPDDRLQGALQTAEREEIPLERVLLREGLLKATTCEHVIQSRAQRARSCTRCGEFTYLQEDQGVHDTACERCGGPLQRTVADAGPVASRAAGGTPPPATAGGAPAAAARNNGPGASGPATRRGPPSGSGPVGREGVGRESAGREAGGRDAGGAARRAVRRPAGGPVPAALKGGPAARTPVGGSPRPSAAPPRAEIKAALASTRDAVKQIADLARPVGEGIEPAPTPPPAERSGPRPRSAPPPLRTQRGAPAAGAEDAPARTPSGARPRPEPARIEPARIEPARIEPARIEPAREEPAPEPARTGSTVAAPAVGESTPDARGEAGKETGSAGATASALEPLLEDAALRLHARLALELRGILSAEADAAAERAIKNVVSQAEDKLEARTRRLEAGLADSARSAAESAVEEARETRTATPGEAELSAWSALVAERVRTALLSGEVPPGWEERASAAAERTAREVAAREAAQAVEAQAAALTAQAAVIPAPGAPPAASAGPVQLDDQAVEHVTGRVLESIWAHLESSGLEGFPGRVVEGVTERARAAAEERVQALPAPPPAAPAELDAAGLEQVTARTLESIWAHLESSGLEGFPARVVEGVIERARAVASERGEPPSPEELRDQAVQGLLALWAAEGAAALPERVREELLTSAAEAVGAAQAAQVEPLRERLEQVENTQRESHLLGAEERSTLEARLAALEARLQVEPPEPGEDPLRAIERRLAALEEAQAVSLAAQARADAARALAPAEGPAGGGESGGAVTHEALEQAIQVALDALEERLQARVDALVANLELRLTTAGDGSSGREALPDEPGPTLEEVDQRVMAALEAHRPAAPELDLEDVAGRVALMATAPVMHAIDQRLAQIDNEVVKRITRQVYAEMRQMAEERRTGKVLRGDVGGD